MFESFRRDLARYWAMDSTDGKPGLLEKLRILYYAPQIQAIAVYRIGNWIQKNVHPRPLRLPLKIAYHALERTTHIMWGIHIDEGAEIGPGLYLGHPGGTFIGPVKMGEDCNVNANVRLGRRTDGQGKGGAPTIGDRVYIGFGSIVFGPVHIGSGATVGPLTVVGRNVGPSTMVNGNPMQIMRKDWDNSQQIYGGTPLVTAQDDTAVPGRADKGVA
jgi:serine O-acetyltransferase